MGAKYTDAQHAATNAYRSARAQITISVTKEEKELIDQNARDAGKSVKQYLVDLAKADVEHV